MASMMRCTSLCAGSYSSTDASRAFLAGMRRAPVEDATVSAATVHDAPSRRRPSTTSSNQPGIPSAPACRPAGRLSHAKPASSSTK
jgi:hypothetical protein